MTTGDMARRAALSRYWLLPAAFVVHDAEELFTFAAWVAAHRARLEGLARAAGLGDGAVEHLPSTLPRFACAVAAVSAVFVVVTVGAWRAGGRGGWQTAFGVLLGGFFLHAFTHIGQALYFGGYAPGAVTAAVVVIPASLYLYRRILGAGLLTRRVAAWGALAGIALFVPAAVLALAAASALASD